MTPRLYHEVKLKDGSIGTVQRQNVDGTWRVWFDLKHWKGDKALADRFGVVKINVKESELEEV